jgi:polyisoprenoid-binding protein YceI
MTARYRLDPGESRFTVQAFAAGVLSFLGHSPTFAVRDFTGTVNFEGGSLRGMRIELRVRADSLELLDPVSAADRREIEGTMRREVLQAAAHPEIRFDTADILGDPGARGRYLLRVGGWLSLRGLTRPLLLDAELLVFDDGIRLRGESPLRLSDYRITPVTALGGTIRLKDELRLSFDLAGLPEGP